MTASSPTPGNMVDWDFAVSMASKVAGPGPVVQPDEARAVVAQLRSGAERSTDLVREFTGLDAPDGTAPILVVDRPGWIRANADAFSTIIDPLTVKLAERQAEKYREKHGKQPQLPGSLAVNLGSKVTGAEVGLLLGYLSGKVLGQFDPFFSDHGRLLLVAPNVVHVERELGADPSDFRLWVCLHEETHRVQFTAVPWMREHLFAQMQSMLDSVDPASLGENLKRAFESLRTEEGRSASVMELVSTPEQRAVIDRITGMMSLLEGHADVVMDGVGPSVIPSVASIRSKFNQRRKGIGTLDKLLRRLLGMDAKMAQYRDGAAFVRAVVDQVGMADFNAVWAGPDNLPSKAEILDPAAWVRRVHGA